MDNEYNQATNYFQGWKLINYLNERRTKKDCGHLIVMCVIRREICVRISCLDKQDIIKYLYIDIQLYPW